MTDEIKPALDETQWAAWREGRTIELERFPGGRAAIHPAQYRELRYAAEHMALNNAALPDDSPYKLTWADVALLRDEAHEWETHSGFGEQGRAIQRLAALIAALLPPEGR